MTRTEYIIDDDFLDDETKMSAKSQGYLWDVIRCKYCKLNPEKGLGCPMAGSAARNDDSFCSWAVRRVDDSD